MLTKKDFIQLAKDFVSYGFKIKRKYSEAVVLGNLDEVYNLLCSFCRGQNCSFDEQIFNDYITKLQTEQNEKLRNLVTDGIK